MNPSYCRVRVPPSAAIKRFASWLGLPQVGPLVPTDIGKAVRLACDDRGRWRGNAVLISEVEDWTLFQDLSGVLSGVSPDRWQEFAGPDELVFAGYNDAIGYGEFVAIQRGQAVRAFLDYRDETGENIDFGVTDFEGEPFKSWIDAAHFVDGDDLGFSEVGMLWVWGDQI